MIYKSFEIKNKNFSEQNIFLVYGENEGLKKDIIQIISKKKNIEFQQYKFDEEEVIQKTENIYNLIYGGSLFDKFKIITINKASDKLYDFVEDIIDKEIQDCVIFFNSPILDKRSKIRNFFEKEKKAACIACYKDNEIGLKKILFDRLKNHNINVSQESINLIINRVSGDRQNLENEIEKISAYCLNKKTISLNEIQILTNLTDNFENEEIINYCLSGENIKLKRMLEENNFSYEDFFILLRILNKKILRLINIKILQQNEKNTDTVLSQIKPPIFWKEKEIVKKQTNLWNLNSLNKIINRLNEVELLSKKNNEKGLIIVLDFLSDICFRSKNSF
jgi:DNA polymerase-3 subunit delta|tara:strand:- start:13896 stop:14900 length:1005 start_codon:yes stop_codon:yes gene_type:complete